MQRYEVVSKPYWSNCLFEAIKAKLNNNIDVDIKI